MALTGDRLIDEENKALVKMAVDAGGISWSDGHVSLRYADLKRLVSFVRADERAQCISACAEEKSSFERNVYDAYDGRYDWKADGAEACIEAILLRGKSDKQD
jgi:hypothetical protein